MRIEDYFERGITDLFDTTLRQFGAQKFVVGRFVIRYDSPDWFVEFVVMREEGPRFCPRIEIGPLPQNDITRDGRIDILYALPMESSLRQYNLLWRYSNIDEMKIAYTQAWNEIVIPYVIRLLQAPDILKELVLAVKAEQRNQRTEEIRNREDSLHREKASASFLVGNYSEFLKEMAQIADDRMTDVERSRISYARKKIVK